MNSIADREGSVSKRGRNRETLVLEATKHFSFGILIIHFLCMHRQISTEVENRDFIAGSHLSPCPCPLPPHAVQIRETCAALERVSDRLAALRRRASVLEAELEADGCVAGDGVSELCL